MVTAVITNNSTGGTLSGVLDARINEDAQTSNFGSEANFYVQPSSTGSRIDSLILFPLPGDLAGGTVSAVTFEVMGDSANSSGGAGGITYQLQRLLQPIVEAEVTYQRRSVGNNWATAGALGAADRDSTSLGSAAWSPSAYTAFNGAALVSAVQAAATAGASFFALAMSDVAQTTTGQYAAFFSSQGSDGNRPKLTIVYTAGASGTAIGQATETDTALALTGRQTRAIGQASETDTAQPVALMVLPGFDFHTATGWDFGDMAGGLVGLSRENAVAVKVRANNVSTGALIHQSSTQTITAGRLGRYANAALPTAGTQCHVTVVRESDNEPVAGLLSTT